MTTSQPKDHGSGGGGKGRRRVKPGSPHIISFAYTESCMHPSPQHQLQHQDGSRIDFPAPACMHPRLVMQSSSSASAAVVASNRSPHLHHHQHPLQSKLNIATDAVAAATATSSFDQSFPLMDPLLSYTHETYLGNPQESYCNTSAIMNGTRVHQPERHDDEQEEEDHSSPAYRGGKKKSNSQSAASITGANGGETGSLDGFEWDNYDETQIKPEHDDDVDWYLNPPDHHHNHVAGQNNGHSSAITDPEEDEESFSEVFRHHRNSTFK